MKKYLSGKIILAGTALLFVLFLSNFIVTSAYSNEPAADRAKIQNEIQSNIDKTDEQKTSQESTTAENADSPEQEATSVKGDSLLSTAKQGGPLMIFLIFLGVISMTIIVERIIFFTRNSVWKGQQLEEDLREKSSKSDLIYREDLEDELNTHFSNYAGNLERGLPLLYGIGNLAPIAGFLGTVIGMISAFSAIAAATTVNAKVVAVGIQIALVTTAGGLIVAAPTLAFFYLFSHIIQNCSVRAEAIITEETQGLHRLSRQLQKSE